MDREQASTPMERAAGHMDGTLGQGAGLQDRAALAGEEARLVERRRARAGIDPGAPRIGLALSGGGIRSATFCLGLLRGLAQNGLLKRFDYLSTVSGGGYVGAAFTRVVQKIGVVEAENAFARSDSVLLEWLRRNGRYLTPRGARDVGAAVATYLRSALAVHAEMAVLAVLLGVLVVLPHALHNDLDLVLSAQWQPWASAWFVLAAAAWMLLASSTLVPYWTLRDLPRKANEPGTPLLAILPPRAADVVVLALLLAGLWLLPGRDLAWLQPPWAAPSAAFFLCLFAAGTLARHAGLYLRLSGRSDERPNTRLAQQRNRLTEALRRANALALGLAGLGVVDVLTWQVAKLLEQGDRWLEGGLTLGSLLVLLRALSEPLQRMARSSDGPHARWTPKLLNLLGLLVGALVVCAWVLLVQWVVFIAPLRGEDGVLAYLPFWARAAVLGALALAWVLLTQRNRDWVNSSSLHGFYRARLVRAYLALGNVQRFGPRLDGERESPDAWSVTTVVPGDDTDLSSHRPEENGGPLHLVGVCLNQTREAASGMYNADRKGLAATISARGMELGRDRFLPLAQMRDPGTLGRWIAISGAAASPGAGSYTSRGWAVLLFMVGARLGFWLRPRQEGAAQEEPARDGLLRRAGRWLGTTKFGLLASEALASFAGPCQDWWYLSDGGHFENTGVHALLQRQLDFIVLSDCGADPRYEYDDLENLVRKARIDFDCDIEFCTPEDAAAMGAVASEHLAVLAPEDLAKNYTARGVLLARICYNRSNPARRRLGTLLVVKPALHVSLDADVLAYARRHPLFPQQPTSDQFFDEAQWESYHRLGEDMGRALRAEWLEKVHGWNMPAPRPGNVLEPLRRPPKPEPQKAPVPFWRPETRAAAIGATVGVGVLGTLLLPMAQALQQWQQERSAREQAVEAVLDRVDAIREASPDKPPGADERGAVRLLADAVRYGGVSARVRRHAASRLAGLAALCQVPADPAGNSCDPARHWVCDDVCGTHPDQDDPYWMPAPQQEPCRNPLLARLPACNRQRPADAGTMAMPEPAVAAGGSTASTYPEAAADLEAPGIDGPTALQSGPGGGRGPASVPEPGTEEPASVPAPLPVEAPAPAPPASARVPALAACGTEASPMTLYVQVHDEASRAWIAGLLKGDSDIAPALGNTVRVPGIENVVATAQRHGRNPPAPWPRPTLLVHRRGNEGDRECARGIAAALAAREPGLEVQVRELAASIRSNRRVIELWLPPCATDAGTPGPARCEAVP